MLLLIAVQTELAGEPFPFVEKHDLAKSESHATLTFTNPTVKIGQVLSGELRFYCRGRNAYYYNPFSNPMISPPAQIAVYDASHKYINNIANLYGLVAGSWTNPSVKDWVYIQNGCSVGKTLEITVPRLPPGDYYLQAIYYKAFVMPNPWRTGGGPAPHDAKARLNVFSKQYDQSELFRSNPVKITFTE